MSRILVTGGAGFIGSHLVDRLLSDGHEVVCVDNFDGFYPRWTKEANLAQARTNPRFRFYEADIRDASAMRGLWGEFGFDAVCHLAARPGVRPSLSCPAVYWDINTRGTLLMLELAREFRVPRFVFASSSSVYGASSRAPFREDDAADRPVSPYAASKRSAELLCHTYHHLYGLNVTCLRFFTAYGPRNRPDLAVARFARLIDAGEPVPVFGDGRSRRDYTYIDDIISGVAAALERCSGFCIYNLGHSEPIELLDLIRVLERALGRSARLVFHPDQPGDVPLTHADIRRARHDLGFEPTTPIELGIQRYVEWYRRQPVLCPAV